MAANIVEGFPNDLLTVDLKLIEARYEQSKLRVQQDTLVCEKWGVKLDLLTIEEELYRERQLSRKTESKRKDMEYRLQKAKAKGELGRKEFEKKLTSELKAKEKIEKQQEITRKAAEEIYKEIQSYKEQVQHLEEKAKEASDLLHKERSSREDDKAKREVEKKEADAKLKSEAADKLDKQEEMARKEVRELWRELQALKDEKAKSEVERKEAQAKLKSEAADKLEKQEEIARKEVRELQGKLKALKDEKAKSEVERKEAQAKLKSEAADKLEKQEEMARKEVRELQGELQALKETHEKTLSELRAFRQELDELRNVLTMDTATQTNRVEMVSQSSMAPTTPRKLVTEAGVQTEPLPILVEEDARELTRSQKGIADTTRKITQLKSQAENEKKDYCTGESEKSKEMEAIGEEPPRKLKKSRGPQAKKKKNAEKGCSGSNAVCPGKKNQIKSSQQGSKKDGPKTKARKCAASSKEEGEHSLVTEHEEDEGDTDDGFASLKLELPVLRLQDICKTKKGRVGNTAGSCKEDKAVASDGSDKGRQAVRKRKNTRGKTARGNAEDVTAPKRSKATCSGSDEEYADNGVELTCDSDRQLLSSYQPEKRNPLDREMKEMKPTRDYSKGDPNPDKLPINGVDKCQNTELSDSINTTDSKKQKSIKEPQFKQSLDSLDPDRKEARNERLRAPAATINHGPKGTETPEECRPSKLQTTGKAGNCRRPKEDAVDGEEKPKRNPRRRKAVRDDKEESAKENMTSETQRLQKSVAAHPSMSDSIRQSSVSTMMEICSVLNGTKKRRTLYNTHDNSLMVSFLPVQESFANSTISTGRMNNRAMPPNLSAFMRSFIAPKLKSRA